MVHLYSPLIMNSDSLSSTCKDIVGKGTYVSLGHDRDRSEFSRVATRVGRSGGQFGSRSTVTSVVETEEVAVELIFAAKAVKESRLALNLWDDGRHETSYQVCGREIGGWIISETLTLAIELKESPRIPNGT